MTCDEFLKMAKEKGVTRSTRGERAAMLAHMNHCPACLLAIERVALSHIAKQSVAEIAQAMTKVQAVYHTDITDPEFNKEVFE